ncbi:hypothetical protein F2Q69_00038374 [Brassica cretica]|uniref:Uncharacterized protein n=1 Tax=Brassica cretica TaxID=69181 RepID=A0A8S9SFI1_BRACR|nr:hypothetical protein F2Q69_00038374 [Brassica cretica]
MQKGYDTDQIQAEAAWERTRSIDTRHQKSIDKLPQQSIDTNNTTSIDNHPIPKITVNEKDKLDNQYLTPDEFGIFSDPNGYAKAIDGRTLHVSREDIAYILQTVNGADNLFMHQRNNQEPKTTKEFNDTVGGIENSFKQRSLHTTHPSINIDVPTVARQSEFGKELMTFMLIHTDEVGTRDLHTKDEINEMFYEVYGEHEKNKEAFQMKFNGVYYPLNDSISWLTTFMEEMKQDITKIQNATDVARPPSIDRRQP